MPGFRYDATPPTDPSRCRPVCHFTPPAGWMNDPNGLVHHAGEWHLYYQHHPGSLVWGPMHWGHAVSRDLLVWDHLGVALAPDEHGTIFSGSAVVDTEGVAGHGAGTLLAFHTYHRGRDRGQAVAYSRDAGRTWARSADDPILLPVDDGPDFRDPTVLRYHDASGVSWWVLLLAAGSHLRWYRSDDLRHWTPTGTFSDPDVPRTSGAPGVPELGVFETPELFELPVDDGPERAWVLSVGHLTGGPQGGSGSRYLTGRFDGERFTPDEADGEVRFSDHGADLYALQSWSNAPDGRRVWVGWMSNWAYAERTPASTWRGSMSIPRELGLTRGADGRLRLVQTPVRELTRAHVPLVDLHDPSLTELTAALAGVRGACLDLELELEVGLACAADGRIALVLEREGTGPVRVELDAASGRLIVDRRAAPPVPDALEPDHAVADRQESPPIHRRDVVDLRILIDTHCLEVFADGGAVTLTNLLWPAPLVTGVRLELGAARLTRLHLAAVDPEAIGHAGW